MRRALLVLVLLTLALAAPRAQLATYSIGTWTADAHMTAFVNARKSEQDAGFGTYANPSPGTYVEMTPLQLWQAHVGIMQALVGDYQAASNTLGPLGLRSYWFTSSADSRRYFVIKEPGTPTKGWGTIVIYPEAQRNLVIAAPHVTYDTDSHTSARRFYNSSLLRPKMLVLGGTFRCNKPVVSGCSHTGAGNCGLGMNERAVSDLNHSVTNLMHAAALAARNLDMRWWGIHSNVTENADLLLGDGTYLGGRVMAPAHHLVRRVRAAVGAAVPGIVTRSCNDPVDASADLLYCEGAGNDTQSRLLNGLVSEPFLSTGASCTTYTDQSSDRYMAFEMRPAARDKIEDIIAAIAPLYPPDLPGTGQ